MTRNSLVLKASAVVVLGLMAMTTSPSRAESRGETLCATHCAFGELSCSGGKKVCSLISCIGEDEQIYPYTLYCDDDT